MPARENCRILALIWHSPQADITAGGFLRAFEIFKRAPAGIDISILDNNPSFLSEHGLLRVSVSEYVIPARLRRLEDRAFVAERFCEWILSFLLMTWRCILLKLQGEKFDLILAPSAEQVPALAAAVIAKHLFAARLIGCNMNIEIFPALVRKPIAWLHNSCDVVITLSRDLEKKLRHYGVRVPMEVNGAGLDVGMISGYSQAPVAKRYDAIFIGRHDREKGIFDLMRAWEVITRRRPQAVLAMVGSCNPVNRRRLETLVAELGLQENVDIIGVVSDEEKFSLIRASRLCLFPSYVEGWAIVPQECLACGLPVVAYDLPVYSENIRDCEAVMTVPVGDWRSLAEKGLELLAGDLGRYESSGPAFVRRFDWDAVAKTEYETLLGRDKLIARRAGEGPHRTFSVVMPALNESRNIGDLLEDIYAQRLPDSLKLDKVVVVSDHSTDGTDDVVREHASCHQGLELVVNQETVGQAQCINIGKRGLESDFIVLLDGDVRLRGPDVFAELLDGAGENVSMLGGNPVPTRSTKSVAAVASECGDYIRNSLKFRVKGGRSIYSAHGRIIALARDLYSSVDVPSASGGLLLAADQFFYLSCMSLGKEFELRNDAEVSFQLPTSTSDYLKQSTRFMFSVANMKDFLSDERFEAEFDIGLRTMVATFLDVSVHRPLAMTIWLGFRMVGTSWCVFKRYLLKEGVRAAWDISESTKAPGGSS